MNGKTLLPGVLLLLAGCAGEPARSGPRTIKFDKTYSGPGPIRIVCTTGMVADLARNIGGERVQVVQLLGPGVDPHVYKATTADIHELNQADLILYSGLHLEGKMGEILERLGRKIPSFAVAEHLDEKLLLRDESGVHDPHVWFDVSLWSRTAGILGEILEKYDPSHAAAHRARTAAYRKTLDALHVETGGRFRKAIKENKAVLVTSHDAFRYFGRAYGVEVLAVQGISTESEASVKDVQELVDTLVRRKVKAVFIESSVNPRNLRAVIDGCTAAGHPIVQGGELFSDAMGELGTPTGTYVGMVRHNVDTVLGGLR